MISMFFQKSYDRTVFPYHFFNTITFIIYIFLAEKHPFIQQMVQSKPLFHMLCAIIRNQIYPLVVLKISFYFTFFTTMTLSKYNLSEDGSIFPAKKPFKLLITMIRFLTIFPNTVFTFTSSFQYTFLSCAIHS